MIEGPKLLSFTQTAKKMGLGRNSISKLVKTEELPTVKIPGCKFLKICIDDIDKFLEIHKNNKNKKNKK
ncbi:MAG: hypothetical protein M0P71_16705 [Melioribacteraceae bacterium]|nr:hypothetical protein [Melioribacteraceae bacterium]